MIMMIVSVMATTKMDNIVITIANIVLHLSSSSQCCYCHADLDMHVCHQFKYRGYLSVMVI